MKSILSTIALMTVAVTVKGITLDEIYQKVCNGETYVIDGASGTHYEPWGFLMGYNLGT